MPPTRRAVTVTRHHRRVWQARCPTGQTRRLSPGLRDAPQRYDAVVGTRPPNAPGRARLPLVRRFLPASHITCVTLRGTGSGLAPPRRREPGGLARETIRRRQAGAHGSIVTGTPLTPLAVPLRVDPRREEPPGQPGQHGNVRDNDTQHQRIVAGRRPARGAGNNGARKHVGPFSLLNIARREQAISVAITDRISSRMRPPPGDGGFAREDPRGGAGGRAV